MMIAYYHILLGLMRGWVNIATFSVIILGDSNVMSREKGATRGG